MALDPFWANWCAAARPIPAGELLPMYTLVYAHQIQAVNPLSVEVSPTCYYDNLVLHTSGSCCQHRHIFSSIFTYCPTDSGATLRMRGMSSKLPASGIPWTNCWLKAWRRFFADVIIVWYANVSVDKNEMKVDHFLDSLPSSMSKRTSVRYDMISE